MCKSIVSSTAIPFCIFWADLYASYIAYTHINSHNTNPININIRTPEIIAATNKINDGTTTVELTGGTITGIYEDDEVLYEIPTEGIVADANPGTGKAVTISPITLSGADAANYTLVQPTGITVDILSPTLT